MRKIGYILFASSGVVLCAYLYSQFTIAKKFSYSIVGITVKSVSLSQIQFLAGFTITNKSDFSAHVTSVNLKAYLGSVMIATITNNMDIIIPAHGIGNVQTVITVLPKQLGRNGITLLKMLKNINNIDLDLVGNIEVKTLFSPIKVPVKYSTTGKDLAQLYDDNFG